MGAEKIVTIIAGLITILATYLFSFFEVGPTDYGWGIGAWIFAFQPSLWTSGFIVYILYGILTILFLLSGLFQLLEAKFRGLGRLGSALELFFFLFFMLHFLGSTPFLSSYLDFFSSQPLGLLPIHIPLEFGPGSASTGLGYWLLIVGAILGFIGSYVNRG